MSAELHQNLEASGTRTTGIESLPLQQSNQDMLAARALFPSSVSTAPEPAFVDFGNNSSLYGDETKLPILLAELHKGHVAYPDMEITQGVRNLNDANKLISGASEQALDMLDNVLQHLSHPYAINEDIESAGPVLDTATNYYLDPARVKNFQHDAGAFTAAGLAQVDQTIDRLSYPMTQDEIGHRSAATAPWFIPGLKKRASKAAALEAGGLNAEDAASLSKSELIETLGARGIEWTEKEYRRVFFEGHPELMPFSDDIVVHHAIEQQVLEEYPGLFSARELNELGNLRGVPRELDDHLHKVAIRKAWDRFYLDHPPAIPPTRTQIIEKANEIDQLYGTKFEPPRK